MSALAFDTKFAPKQTRRFILRCRGKCMKKPCPTVVAADCPVEDVQRYTRGFVGVPGSAVPYIARVANTRMLPDVWCVAHRQYGESCGPLERNRPRWRLSAAPRERSTLLRQAPPIASPQRARLRSGALGGIIRKPKTRKPNKMSTRATIHFLHSEGAKPTAIIYRHGDGYPDGLGEDLKKFVAEVKKLSEKRFNDPSYLAAKWVVWDAMQHVQYGDGKGPLDFRSVGIVDQDPGDIEYRYTVICDGVPTITHEEV